MITLDVWDLLISGGLVVALAGVSVYSQLSVGRDLIVASLRMAIQLALISLVLKVLFEQRDFIWILLMSIVMVIVAGREVVARQERPLAGWAVWGIGTSSLFVSSLTVASFALVVLVQPQPWFHPQYAIPLLGMLLGNTMNAVALSMDRLTSGVWSHREVIEQRLMLGEDMRQATGDLIRASVRGGLIPIINAMAVAGLVSLPGMMTGQILSGVAPTVAVKYQILIWFLIAAGSGFGMLIAVHLTCRQLFDDRQRLMLSRLRTNQDLESR